jgi:hypothetical protein
MAERKRSLNSSFALIEATLTSAWPGTSCFT